MGVTHKDMQPVNLASSPYEKRSFVKGVGE